MLTITPRELYGGRLLWTSRGVVILSEGWIYGPYITLPPGNYSINIQGSQAIGEATSFTLVLELKNITPNLESRIIPKDRNLVLELERIEVKCYDTSRGISDVIRNNSLTWFGGGSVVVESELHTLRACG
ncbi:hypothetical protein [Desulfurococcus amylolyticus]|uniref:hypothetical protein n=1 Tax=Desulfurococcus amylolyticus TaxID=94694 RepID=UPI0018DCA129|nr:hypothetical protein [Desulfurococcus amylolyticus]